MSIICIVDKLREIKSEGIDFSKVIDLHDPDVRNKEVITLADYAPTPDLNSSTYQLNFYKTPADAVKGSEAIDQ